MPASERAASPERVERAIADAALRTGVDFDFLVAQARIESSLNPDAGARTSSARGLYQFIDSTWLSTMQRHGARFGLGDVAARIARSPGGEAHVADSAERRAILALRRDPEISALMAAGLAQDNGAHLTPVLGRAPDHRELYLAHFLGAGGAARFLTEMAHDPDQSAAALFPRPAAANRAIFHEVDGRARSLAGVMEHLSTKLGRAGANVPGRPIASPPPIADRAVFPPGDPSPFTGARHNRIAPGAMLTIGSGAPAAPPPLSEPRPAMSRVLSATLEGMGKGVPALERASGNIRAAYDRLKAVGL